MSALLACGFLVSCFSVNVFAAASPQTLVPLSDAEVKIFWHSTYNGDGVSYGSIDGTQAHTLTIGSWRSDKNSGGALKGPKLDAIKFAFNQSFHMQARSDYLLSLAGVGVSFDMNTGPHIVSFYDQYNNLVWSGTYYAPSTSNDGNGFLYYIIRDLPTSLDVKNIRYTFNFNENMQYADGTFGTGNKGATWLQLIQLEKGADADDVIKAIEDQTASDQSRYDDFTSNGSEQGSSAVESTQQSVSEKIGILDFAEGVLSDFIGLFSASPGDATLTLPGFKWHDSDTNTDLTVWESQTFDFAFVEEHFGPLVSALRVGTVLTVYGALLWYLQAVFDRIFGGGDRN